MITMLFDVSALLPRSVAIHLMCGEIFSDSIITGVVL